jgi:hypothetical protein
MNSACSGHFLIAATAQNRSRGDEIRFVTTGMFDHCFAHATMNAADFAKQFRRAGFFKKSVAA